MSKKRNKKMFKNLPLDFCTYSTGCFFFFFYKQALKGVHPKPNLPKYASRNFLWHIAPLNAN